MPDVEEALALLDELAGAGLHLNAFKPGTVEQVRQVLAIADAAPQHTIAVHLEGGHGGGHHSWEELDELLLETYHELRARENVLLCVGGGVGDPARAADLLCGTWSLAYDEPAMPVDAVLVGTAAMACREAAASPAVKAALVAASGSAGLGAARRARRRRDVGAQPPRRRHPPARHARRRARRTCWRAVAGDARGGARPARGDRRGARADTAKPYLGDVEAMTYRELLARFTERCATGRFGRYDDGAWGHPTWRARALALYRRFGARLHPLQAGPIPAAACRWCAASSSTIRRARWRRSAPPSRPPRRRCCTPPTRTSSSRSATAPGKPVPFVPVLDGEVRRWFMADALWQAQDDRLGADGVFVIPGPRSVAGITRADEPVGELLARFEAEAIARVVAAGGAVSRRDRLADPGLVPAPLAGAITGYGGLVAAFCAAPSLLVVAGGRALPNPLWRVVVPGDEVHAAPDEHGGLAYLEVLPAGGPGERLHVAARGRRRSSSACRCRRSTARRRRS